MKAMAKGRRFNTTFPNKLSEWPDFMPSISSADGENSSRTGVVFIFVCKGLFDCCLQPTKVRVFGIQVNRA